MTPAQLAKSGTEHGEQTALFAYVAVAHLRGFDVADEWCKTGKLPKYDVSPKALPREAQDDEIARFGRVVTWANAVPALEWFHAIHNQGHGDKRSPFDGFALYELAHTRWRRGLHCVRCGRHSDFSSCNQFR